MRDGELQPLVDALRGKADLEELNLSECKIADCYRESSNLAEVISTFPKLRKLDLSAQRLRDDAATELAKALRNKIGLREVTLKKCGLSDNDIAEIAEALSTCPNLSRLDIEENNCSEKGIKALTTMVRRLPKLNILSITPDSRQDMHAGAIEDLATAVGNSRSMVIFAAKAKHTDYPAAILSGFAKGKHGQNLPERDNSERAEEIRDEVKAFGDSFSECPPALLGNAADLVIPALNKRGMQLTSAQLLNDGAPSPGLEGMLRRDMTRYLFTMENWQGQDPQELQEVYRAIPEARREAVGNYYTMKNALNTQSSNRINERGR